MQCNRGSLASSSHQIDFGNSLHRTWHGMPGHTSTSCTRRDILHISQPSSSSSSSSSSNGQADGGLLSRCRRSQIKPSYLLPSSLLVMIVWGPIYNLLRAARSRENLTECTN